MNKPLYFCKNKGTVMESIKANRSTKISLAFGQVWLMGGILLMVLNSKNLFFTLF